MGTNFVHLAEIIRAFLTTRHGALYANEKTELLRGMHTLQVLDWAMFYLDGENQRTLAERLGVTGGDFGAVRRVLAAAKEAKG